MAVENSNPIQRLPWAGGTGTGRPSGMWSGVVTTIMDASGGLAAGGLVFQEAGDPLNAILYHLGQFFIIVSGAAGNQQAQLKTNGMGWGDQTSFSGSFQFNQTMLLPAAPSGGAEVATTGHGSAGRSWLLGVPLRSVDAAELQANVANVNGDTLTLAALGYYWDQTALAQLGAPRLPEGNIWG